MRVMTSAARRAAWILAGAVALAAGCASSGGDEPDGEVTDEAGVEDASRTAFVHLFEWKWTDIARECETYLSKKGFTAVQISPPNEHNWITSGDGAPYPWWMRYQPVSYSLTRSRSGTRAEFIDMVNRCNAVGVAIYADAVINHMTAGSGTISSAGNRPWGVKSYPNVPYGPNDFHNACSITNYNDANNVQFCELSGLHDLNTGASYVRGKIADYLVELWNLGVRGFRIDAAKHMSPTDLGAIISQVESRIGAQPYWFLEVIGATGEAVQPSQYFGLGNNAVDVTEFKFGPELYGKFADPNGRLADLRTFGETWGLMPTSRAVVFTDNHDKQRGHGGGGNYLTYHNGPTYDIANVFMLAWPYGYPALMSSYAFSKSTDFDTSYGPPHDSATGATRGPWDGGVTAPACLNQTRGGWVCEHRFRPIGNMVAFRKAVAGTAVTNWWDNGNDRIAFGRGNAGFVVINGEAGTLSRTFATGLPAGQYCDVISGDFTPGTGGTGTCAGTVITVDAAGNAAISVGQYSAAAIYAGARVSGGGGGGGGGTVAATFNVAADTVFGENVFIVGNVAALASWNTASAVPLTYISGSGTRGNWRATVNLPASTAIEYKYIKKNGAGAVTWESGANRALTTGAGGTTLTTNDSWK